jgi:GT2 family glycosyltransferase
MELSIVLVTYNSEEYISGCLHSILKATEGMEREILVIDNHSNDRTIALLREFNSSLKLIENEQNEGFAKAVNKGFRKSSGEFCLLINPDVMIQSNSLNPMIQFMKENPKVGVCGCKLLNGDGSLQYSIGPFPGLLSPFWRMFFPRPMRKYDWWGYDRLRECDWVTGAFMLLQSKAFQEVKLLDEQYFMYYEDVDLCLRVKRAGWQVYYYPGITAVHLKPQALYPKGSDVKTAIRKSRRYYYKKNVLIRK